MVDQQKLLSDILRLEDDLIANSGVPEVAIRNRIIAQDSFRFEADGLVFVISLKKVVQQSRFITIRFEKPAPASFTFTSFAPEGKRMVNKYKFKEMVSFLAGSGKLDIFAQLVEEKIAGLPA